MRFECRNFVIYLFESDRNKVSSILIKLLHVENILVVICVVDCNISTAYCLLKFRETYRNQLITMFVVDLNVKFNSWDDLTSFRRMVIQKECGNKLRDASGGSKKKERKVAQPKSSFFSTRPNFFLFFSLVRYFVNNFSFHFNCVTARSRHEMTEIRNWICSAIKVNAVVSLSLGI